MAICLAYCCDGRRVSLAPRVLIGMPAPAGSRNGTPSSSSTIAAAYDAVQPSLLVMACSDCSLVCNTIAEMDIEDSFKDIFISDNHDLVRRTIQLLTACHSDDREKVIIALGSLIESSRDDWRRYYAIEGLSRFIDRNSILLFAKIWTDRNQPTWIRLSAGRALLEIDKAQRGKMGCQQQKGQETFETRAAVVALKQVFSSSIVPSGVKTK